MDVKIKNRILKIEYKLKRGEMYKIIKGKKFNTVSIYNKPVEVIGFSNSTQDTRFIPVLDYDNVFRHIVEEDYKLIQREWNLTPAYIFTTKEREENGLKIGNYHIICLKRFKANDVFEIIKGTRCDSNYKTMHIRNPYRSWVLRLSEKKNRSRPKYLGMVGKNINLKERISSSHKLLLSKLYENIEHPKYKNEDNLKEIKLHKYETLNT